MNAVVELPIRETAGLLANEVHRFSAAEIRDRVNHVQEVMRAVMKQDVHYGKIPGTPKPTLYKPGAEVLCVAFRIAPSYRVEDLGDDQVARFRVTCVGTHQVTGINLGEGMGECSSAEEKYKWRAAVTAEEFNYVPETLRRLKFYKNGGKATQVRTEVADLSNTVLKMACKRAHIAMTLAVTAASDMFAQDIEDLPEELRPYEPEHAAPATSAAPAPEATPELIGQAKAAAAKGVAAYQKFWSEAGAPNRKALAAYHEGWKVEATTADQARTVDTEPAGAAAKPLSDDMQAILADFSALADEGLDLFNDAWGRLSPATQDGLAEHYPVLKARAEAAGAGK